MLTNHFTQQPDNIIPQNVRNNNELYFPKAQDNQSQQVQIPGLDLCPDSTPLIQEQHHPVLKQGQELSMQDVEHTGLMNFPLQSEPMIDNRQQSYILRNYIIWLLSEMVMINILVLHRWLNCVRKSCISK
jgi:hypothetical protein